MRPQGDTTIKELTNNLEITYQSLPVVNPEENSEAKDLYERWLGGQDNDKAMALLHTQYHAVEKMNTALNIKW